TLPPTAPTLPPTTPLPKHPITTLFYHSQHRTMTITFDSLMPHQHTLQTSQQNTIHALQHQHKHNQNSYLP
ncbi:hypothetical protein SARC_13520, partial [Sphaeroforma arctica JP610]